jgi:hypothetical protein
MNGATEVQPANICRHSHRLRNGHILRARLQRQESGQETEVTASGRVALQLRRLLFLCKPATALVIEYPCASHKRKLTWTLDRSKWSLHGRFTFGKQTPLPIERQARWAQSWSGDFGDETSPCREYNKDSVARQFGSLITIPT